MKNASRCILSRWSIACLCSFINFIQLGIARLSGLLYVAALPRYGVDRSHASFPFVLCYTVRNVSGPFVGYLGRKYGVQAVIVSGCIISSIGIGTCFLAEDITTVTVLWGGIYGLGFGLSSVLIPEVINQHFDEYVTNANGIAFGGECVAGFLLPVLFNVLVDSYGASGTFLILSGLALHSVPAALLLRSPSRNGKSAITLKHESANQSITSPTANTQFTTDEKDKSRVVSTIPMFQNKSNNATSCFNVSGNEKATYTTCKNPSQDIMFQPYMVRCDKNPDTELCAQVKRKENSQTAVNIVKDIDNLNDKSNFQEQDNQFLESVKNANSWDKCLKEKLLDDRTSNSTGIVVSPSPSTITVESSTSPFCVFLDPSFILIAITQSGIIFLGTMFITIIVDLSRDAGVCRHQEVYILVCYSIADMLGRFCLGWITDGGYLTNIAFSTLCYTCMGAAMFILIWLRGFAAVMATVFVVGLCIGGLLIVSPGIVSNYIEQDKVTMALASRYFLYAPMSLTQSYLIGFFRGHVGSYNGILYLLGIICCICSILSFAIPCTTRYRDQHKKRTNLTQEIGCINDSNKNV